MRPKYTRVRARSANEGSGTVGWSRAALVDACFLMDEEDISALSKFAQSTHDRGVQIAGRGDANLLHGLRPLASIARFASSTLGCTGPGQLCKKSMTQGTRGNWDKTIPFQPNCLMACCGRDSLHGPHIGFSPHHLIVVPISRSALIEHACESLCHPPRNEPRP